MQLLSNLKVLDHNFVGMQGEAIIIR